MRRLLDAFATALGSLAAHKIDIEPYKVIAASAKTTAQVYGVGHRHREVTPFALVEGRFIDEPDETHHAQVAVIGAGGRRDLFGAEPALGKDVKSNDVWFEVIGVLAPEPAPPTAVQGVSVSSAEHEIYLPFATALRKLDHAPLKAPLGEIVVRLDEHAPAAATRAVLGTLRG